MKYLFLAEIDCMGCLETIMHACLPYVERGEIYWMGQRPSFSIILSSDIGLENLTTIMNSREGIEMTITKKKVLCDIDFQTLKQTHIPYGIKKTEEESMVA